MNIIDGKKISDIINLEITEGVLALESQKNIRPGLATILVGDNPASLSYVTSKIKRAKELGFHEVQDNQNDDITTDELINIIEKYNNDEKIHGILVQLPLPSHIDTNKVIESIDYNKDVDGFHPVNAGRLFNESSKDYFIPCTPLGIYELLLRYEIETVGKNTLVIGRSNIVGKAIAAIMSQKNRGNSTVTLAHSRTQNIEDFCKKADILIAAIGIPAFVKGSWIKEGAVVIDVGVNKVGTNQITKKNILKGDVDFEQAKQKASLITPVPRGVGPMTITMLMKNTLNSAQIFARR